MTALTFIYFEVRPCILETYTQNIMSFTSETAFEATVAAMKDEEKDFKTFWTLYGIHHDEAAGKLALSHAIGDFDSKEAAHTVMNAILAPMARARDLCQNSDVEADNGTFVTGAEQAADYLEDFINQSSNLERI